MKLLLQLLLIGVILYNECVQADNYYGNKTCECKTFSSGRIIGGTVSRNRYPWHVSIGYDYFPAYLTKVEKLKPYLKHLRKHVSYDDRIKTHYCGGVIIDKNWILTSAHCVFDKKIEDIWIGWGSNDLEEIFMQGRLPIAKKVIHHRYVDELYKTNEPVTGDVALLYLEKDIEFNENVGPACLEQLDNDYYQDSLDIIGWGSIQQTYKMGNKPWIHNYKRSQMLKRSEYSYLKPVVDDDGSRNWPAQLNECIDDTKVCLKSRDPIGSPCTGDSGSPAHVNRGGHSQVIGLASEVDANYDLDKGKNDMCVGKAVYSRISFYTDFIARYASFYCTVTRDKRQRTDIPVIKHLKRPFNSDK